MHKLAEHEILNSRLSKKNIKKFCILLAQISLECMLFFQLINVKLPANVGILTFISRKNVCSAELSMNSGPDITPVKLSKTKF